MPDSIASYAPALQVTLASERSAGSVSNQQTQAQNRQNEVIRTKTTVSAASQTSNQPRNLSDAQDGQDISAAVANGSAPRGSFLDISV